MVLGFYVFHYLLRILPSFLPFYLFPFLSPSLPLPSIPFSLPAFCPLFFPAPFFLSSLLSFHPPFPLLSSLLPSLPPSLSLFFLLLPFLLPSLLSSSSSSSSSSLPPFLLFLFRPSLLSYLPSFFLLSLSFLLSSLLLFLPFFVCWCFISRNVFEFFPRQFLICSLHQVVVFQLKERSLLLPLHRLSACELGFVFVEFYFTHSSSCRCQFSFYSEKLLVVLVASLKAREKSRPSFPSYFTQNLRHLNSWKKSYKNHRFPEGSTVRRIPYLFWLPWRHF